MELYNRCWAEIDLDNLRHNFQQIKKKLHSKTLVMAVVKADAYGHGAKAVAKALEQSRAGLVCGGGTGRSEEPSGRPA